MVGAWLLLATLVGLTAAVLLPSTPAWALGVLSLGAAGLLRTGRGMFLVGGAFAVTVNALLVGAVLHGETVFALGAVAWTQEGLIAGIVGGLRLTAILGVNVAAFQCVSAAAWVDALGLPHRASAFLAAVLLAAKALGEDLVGLSRAQRSLNGPSRGRTEQARRAAQVLPNLLVRAGERSRTRAEALRMAGIQVGPRFAPIVAVAALGAMGRLPFVALPNVALTYVVVFAGGIAFGARAGAWGAFWAMMLTDVFLTGLLPTSFVNAPAMALVGAMGGWFRRAGLADATWGPLVAGALGVVATFGFSVVADTLDWLLVPEFRGSTEVLTARIAWGLAFNVLPAALNAVLFALAAAPVARAWAARS